MALNPVPRAPKEGEGQVSASMMRDLMATLKSVFIGGPGIAVNHFKQRVIITNTREAAMIPRASTGGNIAVRAASFSNIPSLQGLLTVDQVIMAAGDLVLVRAQTDSLQNGIYRVRAPNEAGITPEEIVGAWIRRPLPDLGQLVAAWGGVTSQGMIFSGAYTSTPTVGTDAIRFRQNALTIERVTDQVRSVLPTTDNVLDRLVLKREKGATENPGVYRYNGATFDYVGAPDMVYVENITYFIRSGASDTASGEYRPQQTWGSV